MKKHQKSSPARARASTSEVLGLPDAPQPTPRKWATHWRQLTELRELFLGKKSAGSKSAKDELPSFSEHMADAATDSYDRDWALAMLSSAQNALYEIEEALNRIANGTYGMCELSGRPIEPARLKAIPWARFSATAQAQLESRSSAGRTQLGELGTYASPAASDDSPDDSEEILEKQAA